MVALEDAFQTRIDEGAFCRSARSSASCARSSSRRRDRRRAARRAGRLPGVESIVAGARDPPRQPADLDSAARARVRVDARRGPRAPAATRRAGDLRGQPSEPHGRAGDPGGAAARAGATASRRRWRRSSSRRISFPSSTAARAWFTNSLNYYLAALFFNAFPLPQREAGARQTLRYIGELLEDGFSVLIFPEGRRIETRRDRPFPPGHRHDCARGWACRSCRSGSKGSTRCCITPGGWRGPGRVRVAFGAPLTLVGDDYEALAQTGRGGGASAL